MPIEEEQSRLLIPALPSPEQLEGFTPQRIALLTQLLASRLMDLGDAAFKTLQEDQEEEKVLRRKLREEKRGFLGLGSKRVNIEEPDKLWLTTQILFPPHRS